MNNFKFSPEEGLLNKTIFPTNPTSEEAARQQIQEPLNQLRDFINATIVEFFNKGGVIGGGITVNGVRSNDKITCGNSYNDIVGCSSMLNGYTVNWGNATIASGAATTVTFKQPFGTSCYNVIATVKGAEPYAVSVNNITETSCTFTQTSGKNLEINYIAIGY